MSLITFVIVLLSFVAGITGMGGSDPAGAGYALLMPILFGHLIAVVPAIIALRKSARDDPWRRVPLLYVLASGLGFIPALILGELMLR